MIPYDVFQQKALATLDQAAAVQNTWYTILSAKANCRIMSIAIMMSTASEDLEVKCTIDGVAITGAQALASFNIPYMADLSATADTFDMTSVVTDLDHQYRAFMLEGRSVKVEVRKTSANGANHLHGYVRYATR